MMEPASKARSRKCPAPGWVPTGSSARASAFRARRNSLVHRHREAQEARNRADVQPNLMRGLEHALQRRLCDLRKRRADFGLFRRRHPLGLDGRNAGLADAAQQRLAKIVVFDGGGGVVMQAAANFFGMGPAPQHMRGTRAHEILAGIWQLDRRSYLGLRRAGQNEGSDNRYGADTEKHCVALLAVFLDIPGVPSVGGNNHWGGGRDRRAAIGEGADAGQTVIRGTSQRGSNHHKGQGEDEAYGPHLTVSGCQVSSAVRRFVAALITISCFLSSAPKAENGFFAH